VIKLLVVDDSALMRKLLEKIFAAEGDFELRFARGGEEALAEIARARPDVVTLDINMPDMDGLACLDRIMIEHPCPVVMVSSFSASGGQLTLEALRRGAVDFVAKPAGAISLEIDTLRVQLLEKVRAASRAKLRGTHRLQERVRHRIGAAAPLRRRRADAGEGLVLVGTSTGGPPALEALLQPLPEEFRWPVVVAQHMPAGFTAALARRLDGICAVTVTELDEQVVLRPGNIYIGKGDADIVINRTAGGLTGMSVAADRSYPWHPSADRLVRSAMLACEPHQLIGVLMTGMGSDGAQAMVRLHQAGGRTIAEAEETAVVWGMPGELVNAGGADWVLPLPEIAPLLRRLAR
jgi:two-component system, chemotaxis family, protein-glutamate methylesterase/glutaminase